MICKSLCLARVYLLLDSIAEQRRMQTASRFNGLLNNEIINEINKTNLCINCHNSFILKDNDDVFNIII